MAEQSFSFVPAEGFTAFGAELRTGAWGELDTSKYLGDDGRLIKAVTNAPATIVLKVQMLLPIQQLVMALKSTGNAKSCDDVWDTAEKRLGVMISAAQISKDAMKRAAAERLHNWLLLGEGAGQTQLSYHQEVDFARKQLQLASEGQCSADIALLELGELMQDISTATDALANAIGHGLTGEPPARRKNASTTLCRIEFGRVKAQLDWMVEFGLAGADKARALALRAPLLELAARYPGPTKEPSAKKERHSPVT